MSADLQRKPNLAIISDTAMYVGDEISIFEPVLREVLNFSYMFGEINWIGYKYNGDPLLNTQIGKKNNIKYICLESSGGSKLVEKIGVLINFPIYLKNIIQQVRKADVIHVRGPSIPCLITIFISMFIQKKIFWYKYAGNWTSADAPLSYRFQRYILKKIMLGMVAVNGREESDYNHIIETLNPCLTENEYLINSSIGLEKSFSEKFIFCFVGRLEDQKGFPILIDVINNLNVDWIKEFHFVGNGPKRNEYESKLKNKKKYIVFHGLLNREELDRIYQRAHFIILPSKSEGFPKVVAEASSFGCIPIVSPISSITNYINGTKKNGIILDDITSQSISQTILDLKGPKFNLRQYSYNAINTAKQFTYEIYNMQISEKFLKKKLINK